MLQVRRDGNVEYHGDSVGNVREVGVQFLYRCWGLIRVIVPVSPLARPHLAVHFLPVAVQGVLK